MKVKNSIGVMVVLFLASVHVNAQNVWGQLLSGLVNGVAQGIELRTLKNVIDNPSLQSEDMKNYLANYRNGDAFMAVYDYKNAAESYAAAWLTGTGTGDPYLKKLWMDYGWAEDTTAKLENACSFAGIDLHSSGSSANGGYDTGFSSGYSSDNSSPSTKSRVCSLCHGTGLKIKESYVGSSQRKYCSTCGKTVMGGHSHVRCDMCKGTGTLNY